MKYCTNCGNPMSDNANFCQKCGCKFQKLQPESSIVSPHKPHTVSPSLPYDKPKKKRAIWVIVLLWLFFWPIMIIITIAKTSKLKAPLKAILICLILVVMTGVTLLNSESSTPHVSDGISTPDNANTPNNLEDTQSNTLFSEIILDETLRVNFLSACEQIGMKWEEIDNLKQVDDWTSGSRYSFTYQGMSFRLYANMDSTVNTIKLGADTDIYKQGFEPYQVKDYMVDSAVASKLQVMSEEYVKNHLNYPSSADFAWLDWAYGRDHDIYSVSSTVTAQNAFGIKDELPFRLIYLINDDSTKLLYFELDGTTISNNMDTISTPDRKKVSNENSSDIVSENGDILLVDGELGTYGKSIDLDGFTSINYYVPEGNYTVLNNGKWCKVYLAKDEYYKNPDGYMENELVDTLEFSEYGESKTLTVKNGEHIELTLGANVTLTPIE